MLAAAICSRVAVRASATDGNKWAWREAEAAALASGTVEGERDDTSFMTEPGEEMTPWPQTLEAGELHDMLVGVGLRGIAETSPGEPGGDMMLEASEPMSLSRRPRPRG